MGWVSRLSIFLLLLVFFVLFCLFFCLFLFLLLLFYLFVFPSWFFFLASLFWYFYEDIYCNLFLISLVLCSVDCIYIILLYLSLMWSKIVHLFWKNKKIWKKLSFPPNQSHPLQWDLESQSKPADPIHACWSKIQPIYYSEKKLFLQCYLLLRKEHGATFTLLVNMCVVTGSLFFN